MRIVGIVEKGLLMKEQGSGDYTEDEKGTHKGNLGGAKTVENCSVTKERAEGYLNYARLPGSVLRFS